MAKKEGEKLNKRLTEGAAEGAAESLIVAAALGPIVPGISPIITTTKSGVTSLAKAKALETATIGAAQGGATAALEDDESENDSDTPVESATEKLGEDLVTGIIVKKVKGLKR